MADFMLDGGDVFDATTDDIRRGWNVVVSGERIAWMGPAAQAPQFSGHRIEARGLTCLPGLIDCHVHLTTDGSGGFYRQISEDSLQRSTLRAARSAATLLQSGITTVRDCGAADSTAIEVARAIADGMIEGPRVLAAGRVITMTGGHGHYIGREADGIDGVRAATRAEMKAGADFIKAIATGGVLTPGVQPSDTCLDGDELAAVVAAAHDAGRAVATHAIGNAGIKNALRAGVQSIEHGFYMDDEALELAIKQGVFLVPTLVALESIVDSRPEGGLPGWVLEKAQLTAGHHRASFLAAVDSGMRIATGTDAGTPFNRHGSLAREIQLMVSYGMSPLGALLAATLNAAENVGRLHEVGTLEVGKRADIIAVAGNPLVDVRALTNVAFVARNGHIHRDEVAI